MHGVAGDRARYRPVRSVLTTSSRPADVAAAFRERLGLERLYLADLDAIEGGAEPDTDLIRALRADGLRLIVDAGVCGADAAVELARAGVEDVVVALETLTGIEGLLAILDALGDRSVILSVDLRDGVPIGGPPDWRELDGVSIARRAMEVGVRRLILLDLAAVGTSRGCPLAESVGVLAFARPRPELITGGGVRTADDLEALAASGADAALVATALHSGAIGRREIALLEKNARGSPGLDYNGGSDREEAPPQAP